MLYALIKIGKAGNLIKLRNPGPLGLRLRFQPVGQGLQAGGQTLRLGEPGQR